MVEVVENVVASSLPETRLVMKNFGNCSSPSVMMALDERLNIGGNEDRHLWLTAFGAGFSAHACELKR